MSVKQQVRNLEAAGVDEDTIVNHMVITHHKARQCMREPSPELSQSAREEIFYDTGHEHTGPELMRMYRISNQELYKAKYTVPPKTRRPSLERLESLYQELQCGVKVANPENTDFEIIAEYTGANISYVHKMLAHHRKREVKRQDLAHLAEPLLREGVLYAEIADELKCSVSTVSLIAIDLGLERQHKQYIDNWPEILKYANEHNITKAAEKFNVTRSNIYYHMRKDDDRPE